MPVFFTSDTHFGHAAVIGHCNRPFASVAEMDEVMVGRWNAAVAPDDEVWHLGDFAVGRDPARVFGRLNGEKHLVLGNHDQANKPTLRLPWASMHVMETVNVDGVLVVLCHYPMRSWYGAAHGSLHLFGHVHGALADTDRSVDVGVDRWDFTPVTLARARARMAASAPSPPEVIEVTTNSVAMTGVSACRSGQRRGVTQLGWMSPEQVEYERLKVDWADATEDEQARAVRRLGSPGIPADSYSYLRTLLHVEVTRDAVQRRLQERNRPNSFKFD